VAYLTSHLLDQGTTTKSAQQIADRSTRSAARWHRLGADLSFANVVVMKDSFASAMDLLPTSSEPAFSPRRSSGRRNRRSRRCASTRRSRLRGVDRVRPTGLRLPSLRSAGSGHPETLAAITREDLQAFHGTLLRSQQHDSGGSSAM
jgi:hypothetical protein